jgi:hypothetical protein
MATAKQIRHAILRSAAGLAEHEPDVNYRCSRFVASLGGWLHDDPEIKKTLDALLGWPSAKPADGA